MLVEFRTRKLERAFTESNQAVRLWGVPVARKYIQRVQAITAAQNFEDIRALRSFRAHQLEGQRSGQWAIDLTEQWRLIVALSEDQQVVTVEEVTNHYGD